MGKIEANRDSKNNKRPGEKYDHLRIEQYWQSKCEEEGVYHPNLESAKRPFYNLMMFPYPSAEGLHVGSVFAFSGADIYGRFKRMIGNDVFEPIGLDGFGIHSENHAIKTGTHPMEHAKRTERNFYRQLRSIGNGFDWEHVVETYDSGYYKWTQWLFVQLFKAGLAYRKKAPVNYCPSCKTVLADEQVTERVTGKEDDVVVGVCERCDTVIEKKNLEQWFFRITNYGDRLLANIEKLDWTEKVKIAQTEWIGKKTGILIKYPILNSKAEIEVFTTRPDTNFGATFIALAPDSEITRKILKQIQDDKIKKEIERYVEVVKNKSEQERQTEGREKTGVFTGLYAINQLTGYRMPVWVSDFVLSGFGTGALVGVPGHDKRDFEFAKKFGLEIKRVVVGKDGDASPIERIEQVQEEEGKMAHSGFLDGMEIHVAMEKIMDYMEEKGYGRRETTYHLRDWLISRQRYWGAPIPMIYCSSCSDRGLSWFNSEEGREYQEAREIESSVHEMRGWYPVKEEELPVKLPYIEDYKPLGTGKSPLANYPDFYETRCPLGHKAMRETDVSDTFLDSSWYFLRYLATEWEDMPFPSVELARIKNQSFDKAQDRGSRIKESEARSRFLPVAMYIGGAEHSVLHLLYARFITMVLFDLGYIDFEEPFAKFYAHGLIIKDGAKMSKSKGNVINPDDYIRKLGADTLRMYLHFLGPFDKGGDFRDTGIEGMHRFIKRIYTLFIRSQKSKVPPIRRVGSSQKLNEEGLKMMHGTIKGVTEDLEHLRYNTAIAKLMTYYNYLSKQEMVSAEEAEVYLKLLAPFAPYLTEELWQLLQSEKRKAKSEKLESIHIQLWPVYDPKFVKEEVLIIPVQVNGKVRDTIRIRNQELRIREEIEMMARESEKVKKYLEEKKLVKVIYVPGKVINFVVS